MKLADLVFLIQNSDKTKIWNPVQVIMQYPPERDAAEFFESIRYEFCIKPFLEWCFVNALDWSEWGGSYFSTGAQAFRMKLLGVGGTLHAPQEKLAMALAIAYKDSPASHFPAPKQFPTTSTKKGRKK